jgi:hypothetical protein
LLLSQLGLFCKNGPAGRGAVACSLSVSASVTEAAAIIVITAFFEFVLPKFEIDCDNENLQLLEECGGPISFSAIA